MDNSPPTSARCSPSPLGRSLWHFNKLALGNGLARHNLSLRHSCGSILAPKFPICQRTLARIAGAAKQLKVALLVGTPTSNGILMIKIEQVFSDFIAAVHTTALLLLYEIVDYGLLEKRINGNALVFRLLFLKQIEETHHFPQCVTNCSTRFPTTTPTASVEINWINSLQPPSLAGRIL